MNTNFKRIAFLKKIPNVPKPNEFVLLNKKMIHSTAMEVFRSGKQVLFLTSFVDPNTKEVIKNDLELTYGISTDVLGKITDIIIKGKDTLCVVEVPFVTVDGLPMMLHIPYNDVIVVDIMISESISLVANKNKTNQKTLDKVVIKCGSNEDDLLLVNLDYLNKFTQSIIYDYGVSELSIIDMQYYHDLENNLDKSPYESSQLKEIIDNENISNEDLIEKLANMEIGDELVLNIEDLKNGTFEVKKEVFKDSNNLDLEEPLKKWDNVYSFPNNINVDWKTQQIEVGYNDYDKNNHVMVDMETLSTENDAVVTEISLAQFRPSTGEILSRLKVKFNIEEMMAMGFDISHSTLFEFWLKKQSPEAIQKVLLDDTNRKSYHEGWHLVADFLQGIKDVNLWGKGPSFDLTKIKVHLDEIGRTNVYRYFNEKCVRTILAIDSKYAKSIEFNGIKHESMSDVEHQIKQVSSIIMKYNLHITK